MAKQLNVLLLVTAGGGATITGALKCNVSEKQIRVSLTLISIVGIYVPDCLPYLKTRGSVRVLSLGLVIPIMSRVTNSVSTAASCL